MTFRPAATEVVRTEYEAAEDIAQDSSLNGRQGITAPSFANRPVRFPRGMRLRFLPLHLALEGYPSLQFGGPPIAWQEWTRHAVTRGLPPRVEASYAGAAITGLDDTGRGSATCCARSISAPSGSRRKRDLAAPSGFRGLGPLSE
jgi:hypothetical protein